MVKKYSLSLTQNNNMRNLLSVISVLLFSNTINAQFSIADYLAQSVTDLEMREVQEQLNFANQNAFKSPFLREVEFRVRSQNFNNSSEDYRLRFSPLNPYERKANKAYKTALGTQLQSKKIARLSKVLKRRYQLLIDHLFLSRREELVIDMINNYTRLLELESNQLNRPSIQDLIQLDKALLKSKLGFEKIKSEKRGIDYLIRVDYDFDGGIDWQNFPLVQTEQIQEILFMDSLNSPQENIYVLNARNKQLLAENDLTINEQESFSNIGFIQAEYSPDRGNMISEHMGIQLGITIPVVNPDRPDLERRKFRLIQNQNDVEVEKREAAVELFIGSNNVDGLIKQYQIVQGKLARHNNFALNANQGVPSIDVIIELLEYKDSLLNTELSIYTQLLESYISLLEYQGRLIELPYRNYLSPQQTEIDIK